MPVFDLQVGAEERPSPQRLPGKDHSGDRRSFALQTQELAIVGFQSLLEPPGRGELAEQMGTSKAETARKALNRLAICLKHAAAVGLNVDLQATDKARALLGKQRHKAENIPAMPWADVPAFYASLSDGTVSHIALRLLILTGVRSGPLRFLRDEQINCDVWTIPGEAMKGRKGATADFRVPLPDAALAVVEQARQHARDGFLFPSVRKGVISDATMSRLMERAGMEARPHGFRSSLRDWIAEVTDTPHDIAETTLGHTVGGAVERAYRRTDFLEQRRKLLERWAQHVTGQNGTVVKLVRA